MRIGFIGLGKMGAGMASRLVDAGHSVTVYDLNPVQLGALVARGATAAADIASACADREAVITMLPNDATLEEVVLGPGGLLQGLPEDAVHVACGTHGIAAVERVMRGHEAADRRFVVCNVLGRPDRAAEGKLGLIVAGPDAAVAALGPMLEALGERTFAAGQNPLSAVASKIANNFILGCAIEAMGEAFALVRNFDVDPGLFYQIVADGLFDCVAYRAYGDVIAQEDWSRVGATAHIGLKDADLAAEAAERVGTPLPSLAPWRDHLTAAIARGEGGLDWSVMAREQFRRSALE